MKNAKLHPLVEEVLVTHPQIRRRTKTLARQIAQFYHHQAIKDNTLVVVGLLKGAIPFMAELIHHLDYQIETHYLVVSSYYGETQAKTHPKITSDLTGPLKGRHVLVVDDVVDSGESLELVKNYLTAKGAKDVRFVTLIDKPAQRKSNIKVDWVGFKMKDSFLIGFGLDYEERLRNLPYIATTNKKKLKGWSW